ncbi:MAG: transposase [Pseudomonadales bacterium]
MPNVTSEATIVADRFHVVRLINQHFLKGVATIRSREPKKEPRKLISLMRRHQWHLSDEQHANLMVYLAEYPVLQTLYVVKQKLIRLMLLKTLTAQRAKEITALCEASRTTTRQPLTGVGSDIKVLDGADHCHVAIQ